MEENEMTFVTGKKKRIAIVSEFSEVKEGSGNSRFEYIAEALSEDYDVTLFASDFDHTTKSHRAAPPPSADRRFQVEFAHEPGYKKNVEPSRLSSHKKFGINLYEKLTTSEPFDLIYCAVPSTDAGLAALRYSKEKGIPLIVDIQDIWPEAFEMVFDVPVVSRLAFAPMKKKIREVYRGATEIVAVSDTYAEIGMRDRLQGSAAHTVFLGTELSSFDIYASGAEQIEKAEGEIWLSYIGTLGHSYDIGTVLEALSILRAGGMDGVVFKIMGDGPLEQMFRELARQKSVRADFMGRLPYPDMVRYLCRSDIAINPIAKGSGGSIINKVGDYAAAALPVINTQENDEYRSLLDEYGAGINCANANAIEVADAIRTFALQEEVRQVCGRANRKLAEERFDRARTYPEIYSLVAETI
jgi:glycosyltransferase involved in cell wall biosynthesis